MRAACMMWLAAVSACGGSPEQLRPASGDAAVTDAVAPEPDLVVPESPAPTTSPTLVRVFGGRGTEPGQFIEPSSVELDSTGKLYVAGHEDRIQQFTAEGDLIKTWGTTGGGDAQFNHPHGLAIDRKRSDIIYVGDQENRRVQAFTAATSFMRAWVDDGFQHIHDVGIDPSTGDIYVGDYGAHIVQKFAADGRQLLEFGGGGTDPGKFNGVWGISTDTRGNVYVADTGNRRVQIFDSTGKFLSLWNGSAAPRGGFSKPTGVFVDAADVVYVCDSLAQLVLLFDTTGKLLETWNLRAITGIDTEPEDIVVDASGNKIYLVEVLGHRVLYLQRRSRGSTH